MNPRQRRGALLLIVAAVGALGLVLGLSAYIADVQAQLGPMAQQLRLVEDVAYLQPIPADAVEVVEVPERWNTDGALTSPTQLSGVVASTDLVAGSVLQESSVVPPPQISVGEREVAILIDPETGVGGKIQEGDIVDVYATFPAVTQGNGTRPQPPRADLVLEAVRIVDVAPSISAGDQAEALSTGTAVPVTFALSSDEALVLAYVESFATEVRLGLRQRTDTESVPNDARRYAGGA